MLVLTGKPSNLSTSLNNTKFFFLSLKYTTKYYYRVFIIVYHTAFSKNILCLY